MFLEQFEYKCDTCDQVSVFDNRPILRRTRRGEHPAWTTRAWCLVCQQVVPSETMPTRETLSVYRQHVLDNMTAEEPIEDFWTLDEIDALIDWRANRQSYPRCLHCGSESVLQEVRSPAGGGLSLLLHPPYGGRFTVGLRYKDVDQRPPPLIIDGEGHPIDGGASA